MNIVLLHGLIRTKHSMSYLGGHLRDRGHSVVSFGYKSRNHSIEEHAESLQEFLVQNFEPDQKINFVTHSLGSIVTRQFALEFGDQFSLGRVAMLGPPNQGSSYARWWRELPLVEGFLGPSFEQLCDLKMDPATNRLEIGVIAGGTEGEKGLSPFVTGNNDGVVKVNEAELEGAKDLIIIKGWHSLLMYQPEVIRQAIHFLENGEFKR